MQCVVPEARPRLRGLSHRVAFYVALAAGGVLVGSARDSRAELATAIYGVLLAGMFGTSATLHRADWGPRAFGWLRRADHAMIFAFIAGTYTPLCMLAIPGGAEGAMSAAGAHLLALAWAAAALGILRALAWPHAPRALTSVLYIAVGWVVVAYLPAVHAAMDGVSFAFVVAGGATYTVGALVYWRRWPDPSPAIFGYHEVFHLLIILGSACHFVAVARVAG